jgi:nitrite reductase/ring-hydroxylating ferredoxin subunit
MPTIDTEESNATKQSGSGTSRRTVLLGVGAVGAVAGLAACSSGGSGTSASTGGSNTKAAGNSDLAKSSDIPVGGGKIFADQLVVVTQPTAGSFKAFSAVCTHQGCTVGSIANGLIMCPCHGSEYSITDGSVKRPAVPGSNQKPLPPKTVTVTNGEISVS